MLIMASLIEKKPRTKPDRAHVGRRIRQPPEYRHAPAKPTRLSSMVWAMRCMGRIRKADLQRDTPSNTYTRSGLTPTPIALPGKAALSGGSPI